ncbi:MULTISPECIES: hypothetical protein [Streptomyces]|uniref:hypothetical protein n=1 Tax=Streptomyces TaxID=1883 RepID=UPI003445E6C0
MPLNSTTPFQAPAALPFATLFVQEAVLSHQITVRQLIHQLQTVDPDLPAYFAINSDWPHAHYVGRIVEVPGPNGAVYLAENGQEGVLPPAVRTELGWADV